MATRGWSRRQIIYSQLRITQYLAQETWPDGLAGMHWHCRDAAILMSKTMMAASRSAKFKAVIDQNPDELFAC